MQLDQDLENIKNQSNKAAAEDQELQEHKKNESVFEKQKREFQV